VTHQAYQRNKWHCLSAQPD